MSEYIKKADVEAVREGKGNLRDIDRGNRERSLRKTA